MKVTEHKILYNKEVRKGYYLMGFNCNKLENAQPGQFITISVKGIEHNMPLRRPFTIYRKDDDLIEIFYKIVGKGTSLFSTLREGDYINVLGPLGNKFKQIEKANVVLLGRGVGMASLACLGNSLKNKECHITTILSIRNEKANIIDDYVKSFSDKLFILKDEDGTSNIENVRNMIIDISPDIIYTCGSKRLVRMLQKLDFEAYVTLEERMGCGLGACVTCPVKTPNGYKRVCKDGPCFNVKEVIL